jgi:hypothetical protein
MAKIALSELLCEWLPGSQAAEAKNRPKRQTPLKRTGASNKATYSLGVSSAVGAFIVDFTTFYATRNGTVSDILSE